MTYSAQLVDQHELLWEWLNSFSTLTTAATGGIYGPPGLPDEWTPDSGPTIMFLDGSFRGDPDSPVTPNSYRIHAYAYDNVSARSLYRILYGLIHRAKGQVIPITGGNGIIIYCKMITGPNPQTDPTSGWIYDWGLFEIHMAENFVP